MIAMKFPDFRNAQSGVDLHSIDWMMSDIHFNHQIRRRIILQIHLIASAHLSFVLDVIAFVRFQALEKILALPSRLSQTTDGNVELKRENLNHPSEQLLQT